MAENISVTPSELHFKFAVGKQLLATITLKNPGPQRVGFKVKTTAPKKYVVRPSSGIAEAGSIVSVQVIMQAQKEHPPPGEPCKDKFMVQTLGLAPGEELTKDTFKAGATGLRESRMRVVLEGHASPPSTILEDEEGSGLGAAGAAASGGAGSARQSATSASVRAMETSSFSSSNAQLKKDVDRLTTDRNSLRRTLDQVQLQRSGAAKSSGSDASLKMRVALVNMAVAVLLAFLLGFFT